MNRKTELTRNIFFEETNIIDDTLTFGEPSLKTKYFSVDKVESQTLVRPAHTHTCLISNLADCHHYVEILYLSSEKLVTTVRSYMKIFDLLGDIGGSGELIFIAIGILYWVFIFKFKPSHDEDKFFNRGEEFNFYKEL